MMFRSHSHSIITRIASLLRHATTLPLCICEYAEKNMRQMLLEIREWENVSLVLRQIYCYGNSCVSRTWRFLQHFSRLTACL